MMELFLTAYDPSDLPGTSIDPLGFERGYLFLADKILPGLTNVASHPRYFALLCAGIHLSGDPVDSDRRDLVRKRRQETILRLERFWALANVLAKPDGSGGVRGVTYAHAWAAELQRTGATRTSAKYPLLSRQSQYGVIGIYANVASGMRFLNREDFSLTPALGEVAAEAFYDETKLPHSLRRAILDDGDVSLATLKAWGEQAHVEAEVKGAEATCLFEALHGNPVRSRAAGLLLQHPRKDDQETELDRLKRIARTLKGKDESQDLREAIECIQEFESCYQLATLALERLLWLGRHHAATSVKISELNSDTVLRTIRDHLPFRVQKFTHTLDNGTDTAFRQNLDRLSDVRKFMEEASGATEDIGAFIGALIARHTDVQHGKFDRGRRKMPWIELNDSRITLTMTRAGGLNREVTLPERIQPHPYRLNAADALNLATAKAVQS
jgi:predicted DNA-binding protein